jgi:hypothetical protein
LFSTSTAGFTRWLHPAGAEFDLKCFKFPILTCVDEELAPIIRRMNPKDNA